MLLILLILIYVINIKSIIFFMQTQMPKNLKRTNKSTLRTLKIKDIVLTYCTFQYSDPA